MNGEFNGQTYAIEERRANRKGLYALEYLLFNQSSEHSCQVSAPEGWDELTLQQLEVARCEYASEVARDLTDNANKLEADWLAFSNELTSAGESGSEFETVHDAVNHLSDAMFYLDSITKDAKLATPLGLVANSCGAQACPEDVESPYANHSVENIVENLNGFEQFFSGGTGIGFVDYLTYVGDEDTAEQMTLAISAAKEQLALYEASLAQTLVDDEAQVEQTHKNVKAITDKLKTDFIHSLALELPSTSAGDND
jgi:predicted lipoprotein